MGALLLDDRFPGTTRLLTLFPFTHCLWLTDGEFAYDAKTNNSQQNILRMKLVLNCANTLNQGKRVGISGLS